MTDSLEIFAAVRGLPEQCRSAARAEPLGPLPPGEGISAVLLVGMGGSGVAGDITLAVAGPTCNVPMLVHKSYECPAFVGPDTLVISISFSGDTSETTEVTRAALDAGARVVVVSSGGELAEIAKDSGSAFWQVDGSIPAPRCAVAAMSLPVLLTLEALGLCEPLTGHIDAAIVQLERRREELSAEGNPAQTLARRIGRTLPIVYGGGDLGTAAAVRWKSQFNENPKVAAFMNVMPELTHNEVCGWGQHGDMTRQVFSLIQLRHDFEHPSVVRGLELVAEISEEIVAGVHTVAASGRGRLAQIFDLILFGDFVSLYMAFAEGIDPGPVPILDELKAQLRL